MFRLFSLPLAIVDCAPALDRSAQATVTQPMYDIRMAEEQPFRDESPFKAQSNNREG
jgi:hypothetical protein